VLLTNGGCWLRRDKDDMDIDTSTQVSMRITDAATAMMVCRVLLAAPASGRFLFVQGAPVLLIPSPLQGIGALATCTAGAFAASPVIPAIRLGGNCFALSTWTAWLTSNTNNDHTNAAPIESRTEFHFMMHLPMVAHMEPTSLA
jgi:hypothetical protein